MRRLGLAVVLLAPFLAGCPIPQPLPDYPPGTITPPRILVDEWIGTTHEGLLGDGAVILVPASCTTVAPSYSLSARVSDPNTIESIGARWFVNYDFRDEPHRRFWRPPDVIPPNADTTNLTRSVPPFVFRPYDAPPPYGTAPLPGPPYLDAGIVRVVELVVSNGFDPAMDNTTAPGANRSPLPGFETQYYRWVYLTVPESSSVQCPP